MNLLLPIPDSTHSPLTFPDSPVAGLYVHVPFCFHKCHYCDFYSITGQSSQRMEDYSTALLLEARAWAERMSSPIRPQTIFLGGGTPSLLPAEVMRRLIEGLNSIFDLTAVGEWTVEVNPATADLAYLRMLRDLGVNRISMGAQSFDSDELRTLERHHHPDDVDRGVELARAAGFDRINIDLIFAIPGQSMDSWRRSLDRAMSLGLSHYSCYGLTYEPNTPMAVRKRMGQIQPIGEEIEIAMLRETRRRLALVGITPYEISNYATPGEASQHNLIYWTGQNYLGLGPSAASHLNGHRFKNAPHLSRWQLAASQGLLALAEREELSPQQRIGERVMLWLRLTQGVNYATFSAMSGCDAREVYADPLDRYGRMGLIEQDTRGFRVSANSVHLTDAIAAEFLNHTSPLLSAASA